MIRTFENTKFGDVILRNIVIDLDNTNLEEGIELTVKGSDTSIELLGYQDLDEFDNDKVEELLFEHI